MAVEDAKTPRGQHEQAGAGKRIRTIATVRSRFSPRKPGAMTMTSSGASRTPASTSTDVTSESRAATAPATRVASRCSFRAHERRVDGNERGRERPFAEEVLEKIRDPERRHECIGGVGLKAEIVSEDALADEAGEPAAEDADGDERRRRSERGQIILCAFGETDQKRKPTADVECPAAVGARTRSRVVRVRCGLSVPRTLHVAGRQSVLVSRACRIRSDVGVPGNQFLIIQNVEHLELDPRLRRPPHWNAVGHREIDQCKPLERLRPALAKKDLTASASARTRGCERPGWR